MPVKKAEKKPATKATKKVIEKKVAETKNSTIVVEKKTDRCECGDSCNCEGSCNCGCNCGCKCGCGLKILILLLIVANLIISCLCLCKKSQNARDLEALKVGGQENLEKLKDGFYNTDVYKATQKESIDAYIEQLGIE